MCFGELHGHAVAVKFLVETGNTKLERFEKEYINIISSLGRSENIVHYYNYELINIEGIDKPIPAIIMKKYLSTAKHKGSLPTYEEFIYFFNTLISTLKEIHEKGIIHRDLKPQNILVDQNGSYVLSDFGIASFNPDFFIQKALTKKGDRLGNIFSAPEQINSDVQPSPSMDIYALGQLCQWFVTGKIHTGVSRTRLSSLYLTEHTAYMYDQIIDRCLQSSINNRYQSIDEILNSIDLFNKSKKIDIWQLFRSFGNSLGYSFPKGLNKISSTIEPKIIERFLLKISQYNYESNLRWLSESGSSSDFSFRKDGNLWLMSTNNGASIEIEITELWIFFSLDYYCDFAIIKSDASVKFEVNDISEYTHSKTDEACLINDAFFITRAEYDNGYAEHEGEVLELSSVKKEIRIRNLESKWYLVGTRFHNFFQRENVKFSRSLLKELPNHVNKKNLIEKYIENILPNMSREIINDL